MGRGGHFALSFPTWDLSSTLNGLLLRIPLSESHECIIYGPKAKARAICTSVPTTTHLKENWQPQTLCVNYTYEAYYAKKGHLLAVKMNRTCPSCAVSKLKAHFNRR